MLRLYDTPAKAVLAIEPAESGRLRMYACGPTVYRDAHVGNMRTFLLPDLIARTARAGGLDVELVQNITDVGHMLDDTGLGGVDEGLAGNDRLLAAADTRGGSALEIAREFEDKFIVDCQRLGIIEPARRPRASECISMMISAIEVLIERGNAYIGADGSVYFDATSVPDYGAISGNRLDQLKPGHRFEGAVDPNKRFHADWALWKRAPETRTQLVWETPWGPGFPGWHIECSAMLLAYLGEEVDIHTGGIDLRFPHHEDERAQTNSIAGHDVVRHWVHGEHLLFEGRKMSKSSGNVVLVADVIARGFDPRALRAAFLQCHYRTQMDLSWDAIAAADALVRRWRAVVSECDWTNTAPKDQVYEQVLGLFEDDLATPQAMVLLRTFAKDDAIALAVRAATLMRCDDLLGLGLDTQGIQLEIPEAITDLLARRADARAARNWPEADRLRIEIYDLGWVVVDSATGQSVAPAN